MIKNYKHTFNLKTWCLGVFMVITCSVFGQNDSLVLKNGNTIVGEIKNMQRGVLTIETDYSEDDFTLTWVEVVSASSQQSFLVSFKNGERYHTKLAKTGSKGKVRLVDVGRGLVVNVNDIVFIKPVKSSFVSRLDASLSFGFNLTKSNNLKQLTARSTLGYTANYWQLTGTYNSVRSKQDRSDEIHRTDANLKFIYFLKGDYYALYNAEFLTNDEQKIKLRMTNRIGLGNYFIHSNYLYLGAVAGFSFNSERFTDVENTTRQSMEGFGSLEFNMFDIKDFSLLTNLTVYPSITEKNRWRVDYKIDLKYDLPLDFFLKLGLTYNFDNQPIQDASKNDYVFQTTFGWEL